MSTEAEAPLLRLHGHDDVALARVAIVAGAADMPYGKFVVYNVVGGVGWVFSMLLGGYFLGSVVPNLDKHIEKVAAVVIFLSLLPPLFEYWKSRRAKRSA